MAKGGRVRKFIAFNILSVAVSGLPSKFIVSAHARIADVRVKHILGRRSRAGRWDPYMKLTVKLTPPLKLWKDRSRLYRRRFLQPRPHFSAFFENCTIYTPSHRSNLKIFKISHNISVKFSRFLNHFLQNSVDTSSNLLFFAEIFTDFCRNFAEYQQF